MLHIIGHGPGGARQFVTAGLQAVPLVVLSERMYGALVRECGSPTSAVAWLSEQANRVQRPVGLHAAGRTLFLAPRGWSSERLAGFVAAHYEDLEATFGPAARIAF